MVLNQVGAVVWNDHRLVHRPQQVQRTQCEEQGHAILHQNQHILNVSVLLQFLDLTLNVVKKYFQVPQLLEILDKYELNSLLEFFSQDGST